MRKRGKILETPRRGKAASRARWRRAFRVSATLVLLLAGRGVEGAVAQAAPASGPTVANPLLPAGADPWSVYHGGHYYYMHTTGRNLTLWRTRDLSGLATAERRVVWTPPATGPYSREIWAPEIHFLDGRWYIYFAADDGRNPNHRMWVLENQSADPMQGEWVLRGKVADPSDRWAIDGTVFEHRGARYFLWSGWEGAENGTQSIYIARMRNPWTLDGERVRISTPTHPWEKVGDIRRNDPASGPPHVDVNEGPQFLARGDRMFIVYSASGCWTDHYALGLLSADATSDPMKPESWTKSPRPVFQGSPEAKAYAPGHNSFFTSPDGSEDWILYHANSEPAQGCGGKRSPRAQRFTWKADGTPDFGHPVPLGVPIAAPSGR